MKFSTVFIAAASLIATTTAHGGVDQYIVGDTTYQGWSPYNSASGQKTIQRQYSSYDPLYIKDLSVRTHENTHPARANTLQTVNIRCNNKGALGTGVSSTIAAGAKLKTHWKQWTHRPTSLLVYMAKCPGSCDNFDGAGKIWCMYCSLELVASLMEPQSRSLSKASYPVLKTREFGLVMPSLTLYMPQSPFQPHSQQATI
jgi:hypothetical protein